MLEKIENCLQSMCKNEGIPLTKHTDSTRNGLDVLPDVEVLINPNHANLTIYTLFVDPFQVAEVEVDETSFRVNVKKNDKLVYQSFKHNSNELSYISKLYATLRSIFDGRPIDQDPNDESKYLIGYFKEAVC